MNKRQTETSIKKYIKRLFGIDVKIKIVNRIRWQGYEYAGIVFDDTITIRNQEFRDGIPQWIIWHEVGHILDKQSTGVTEREYNAEMFALSQAHKRRYYRILQKMIDASENWQYRKEGRYRKAYKMIYGDLKQ